VTVSSLGASWVFSIQPVLPPVIATFHWIVLGQGNDAVTGTRLVSSNLHTSGRAYATAGSVIRLLGRNGT